MKNIVMRNYAVNSLKWQRTYIHAQDSIHFDIGYGMNIKLQAIKRELSMDNRTLLNSGLFKSKIEQNIYGSTNWSPFQEVKESDDIIKLVQWQAKGS